jgi:hypothetical protein
MPAIAFTTVSTLQMICLRENNVPFFGKIVIIFVKFVGERIHIADRQS